MADFEKVYSIKLDVSTALRNLDKFDKKLDSVSDDAEKNLKDVKKGADKASAGMKNMGKQAAITSDHMKKFSSNVNKYVVLPLAAIGAVSIKSSMELNKSMASVASLLENPTEKIDDLKRGVQSLAVETGQSTTALSEGLYQVVSALGESNDNMAQLGLAARAAKAGVSTAADAIGMLSAVGKGYNDVSAESLERTADLAFQTVKLGVTTFPELAAAMGKVVPLSAAMNTSQEELFGTMATLTGVTGNTSEVTTQLASVYSAFMTPGEAMQDAIAKINKENKEYNFTSASAMMKALGFKKSIELLNDAADGNQDKLAKMLKRKEALLAVLPLVSTQSENYEKKLEAMKDASGAMNAAFREQTEGINEQGHSWDVTKQRMVVMSQRLGDRLLPVLDRVLDMGEPIIQWLEKMDDEAIDNALSWAKLAVEFAVVLKVLSGISSITSAVAGGMSAIGSSAANATGSVSGLAGALGKVNAGLAAFAVGWGIGSVINKQIEDKEEAELEGQNRRQRKIRSIAMDKNVGLAELDKMEQEMIGGTGISAQDVQRVVQGGGSQIEQQMVAGKIGDFEMLQEIYRKRRRLEQQAFRGGGFELLPGETAAEAGRGVTQNAGTSDQFAGNFRDVPQYSVNVEQAPVQQPQVIQQPPPRNDGAEQVAKALREFNPWAGQTQQNQQQSGGTVTINQGDTNITTAADAASVGRVLDARDRRTQQELKRAAQQAAAGEQ